MKKILSIALILIPALTWCQKGKAKSFDILPVVDGVVIYTGVITLDSSISKVELFNRAKVWFVNEYKSAKDVIQMEDKDAGVIMGKGIAEVSYVMNFMASNFANISHTVKIYVKDGKYKYEITDLSGKFRTETGMSNIDIDNEVPTYNKNRKEKILVAANTKMNSIIEHLKAGMNKPLTTKDF